MASAPHPVAPMSLDEARRMIADADFAVQFDEFTRRLAWRMVHAARRGQSLSVLVIITDAPHPPGDAA